MKFKQEKSFSALKSRVKSRTLFMEGIASFTKQYRLLFFVFLFAAPFCTIHAQGIMKTTPPSERSGEINLYIKGLHNKTSVADLEKVLSAYPTKITEYRIDKVNDAVTVLISDKIKVVDVLEVLEMNGFYAAYLNENKQYVTLDKDNEGELAEPVTDVKK